MQEYRNGSRQEVYTLEVTQKEEIKSTDRLLEFDLSAELNHGIAVSNLAYAVAKELGQEEEFCYQLAIAGMLHDIGKLKLTGYINGQERDPLLIEELKYVRMHPVFLSFGELVEYAFGIFPVHITEGYDVFGALHIVDVGVSHTSDTYGCEVQFVGW